MLASRLWADLRGKTGRAYQEALESITAALRGERPGTPPRRGALGIPGARAQWVDSFASICVQIPSSHQRLYQRQQVVEAA